MRDQNIAGGSPEGEDIRKENRHFNRTPCSEGTHFLARRRLYEGVIKNFSRGGTYIETDGYFFPGQEVTVAGPFEGGGQESKLKGAVVRSDGRGIAVKFTQPV
mgnify:CR=1 FL=1